MNLDVNALRASFAVAAQDQDLVARFYTRLFERHPSVQPLFGGRVTPAQRDMLTRALVTVLDQLEDPPALLENLRGLGARHVRYGVTNEMYPWVGACLVDTLAEACGESWTPRVEQAWRAAYTAIATAMLEGAASVTEAPTRRAGQVAVVLRA